MVDKDKEFTFVIITYNHKNYILEHLESIKYQIQNFGKNYKCHLIIADDCSTDDTVSIIKEWIASNSIFDSVKILESEKNEGICRNYVKAIKEIKSEYFKVLAGDDFYTKENIFNIIDVLKINDIVCTPIMPYKNDENIMVKRFKKDIFYLYNYCGKKYSNLRYWYKPIPFTPGVFINKKLLTDTVLDFILECTMLEDRSEYIKIFDENKKLKIACISKVIVFYRWSENAVSRTKSNLMQRMLKKDRLFLDNWLLKRSKNKLQYLFFAYKKIINTYPIFKYIDINVIFMNIRYYIFNHYKNDIKYVFNEFLDTNNISDWISQKNE